MACTARGVIACALAFAAMTATLSYSVNEVSAAWRSTAEHNRCTTAATPDLTAAQLPPSCHPTAVVGSAAAANQPLQILPTDLNRVGSQVGATEFVARDRQIIDILVDADVAADPTLSTTGWAEGVAAGAARPATTRGGDKVS
jgi:CelD/BcsL family acetyltransferase involved in cellulose biosynthesis